MRARSMCGLCMCLRWASLMPECTDCHWQFTGACSLTRVPCCAVLCCAMLCGLRVQVGESLDIEILRGNSKEHVSAVLEPNA